MSNCSFIIFPCVHRGSVLQFKMNIFPSTIYRTNHKIKSIKSTLVRGKNSVKEQKNTKQKKRYGPKKKDHSNKLN